MESKRCFECGATYPKEALSCQLDGTPLSWEIVGRRWKVEGLLARRSGGGVFAAFHLHSGVRAAIDVVPWPLTEDPAIGGRLYGEVQALRLLEKVPQVPRLLEKGTDRDGSRFVITELNDARPLRDLMDEWRKPPGPGGEVSGLVTPSRATQLMGPVLSLLAMAHRMGIAHGELSAASLQVGPAGDNIKLRGLVLQKREPGPPQPVSPVSVDQVQADLRGVAALLYELVVGRPRGEAGPRRAAAVGPKLLGLLERALHVDPAGGFQQIEDFTRAWLLLAPPPVPVSRTSLEMPKISQLVPVLPSRLMPVLPGATQQQPALPPPLAPLPKAGLTHELRQVNLLELMPEPERSAPHQILAVSRNRPPGMPELEVPPALRGPEEPLPPDPLLESLPGPPPEAPPEAQIDDPSFPVIEVFTSPTRAPEAAAPIPAPVPLAPPAPPASLTPVRPVTPSGATPSPRSALTPQPSALPLLASALAQSGLTPQPPLLVQPRQPVQPLQPRNDATPTLPAPAWQSPVPSAPVPVPVPSSPPWQAVLFWAGLGVLCAAIFVLGLILLLERR